MIEYQLVSALEKIIPAQTPPATQRELHLAAHETGSVQVAFKCTDLNDHFQLLISGPGVHISAYKAELVPVTTPAPANPDDAYLVTEPTLLPDVLHPLGDAENQLRVTCKPTHSGWNTLWIDLSANTGNHTVQLNSSQPYQIGRADAPLHSVGDAEAEQLIQENPAWSAELTLHVANLQLTQPQLVNTQWFHADSLANYHKVEVWSEEHWQIIENHVASAAKMGVNCLLTPLWTPPLDTAVGTYRTSTQLLEIISQDGAYKFNFDRARRWLQILKKYGITDIEVPHFFTQWGATSTPRFYVGADGTEKEALFGWDEPATSALYRTFLEQLIPAVRAFLANELGENHAWYHISDEPTREHLEAYQAAKAQVSDLLSGAQIIDALSDPDFLTAVDIPVVASNHVNGFRNVGVEPTWVYNCVAQDRLVANRFIAQRGTRHREIGFQLYKTGARGILHWAFNFYNRQYSLGTVNPYADTAAGGAFISGDSFVVYPTADGGLLESLRHRLLRAAMNDLALCQAVEERCGRDAVLAAIDPDGNLNYDHGYATSVDLEAARARLLSLV